MAHDVTALDFMSRLAVGAALGVAIGFERRVASALGRSATTSSLVATGAALFALLTSILGSGDHTRIIAGVRLRRRLHRCGRHHSRWEQRQRTQHRGDDLGTGHGRCAFAIWHFSEAGRDGRDRKYHPPPHFASIHRAERIDAPRALLATTGNDDFRNSRSASDDAD